MTRIFMAPGKYIQGAGAIAEVGKFASVLGAKKAFVMGGKHTLAASEEGIRNSLTEAGLGVVVEGFRGESSDTEINRLMAVSKNNGCDIVIGAGGGKGLDTAKAVACDLGLPVIIIPTIASCDAPCSALSVIYTDDGVFARYKVTPTNPQAVLVDTDIIAKSPVRTLVAGMGDALATFWEADTCYISEKPNCLTGGTPLTEVSHMIARLCYDTLLQYGVEAKYACDRNVTTRALERIVEANTLLSGLGFESGGLAAAHSIHNGLTALEPTHKYMHGEKVAFGTLTQMVLENRPREQVNEVLNFCKSVGLPTNLRGIGLKDPSKEDIMKVAKLATAEGETIHATWFPVTAEMVAAAMWAADAVGSA